MASENLTLELWEIIQNNNQEEISYSDFEKDLNKAFNLPKDEVDRALTKMISQAEVNPNIIGEYKGGSFMISQSFAAVISSTIKYENQFIPGKQEYLARELKENITVDFNVVAVSLLAPEIVDRMIADYDKLSDSELDLLWESYTDMDQKQRKEMDKAHDKALKEKQDSKDTPPNVKEDIKNVRTSNKIEDAVIAAAQAGDEGAIKVIRDYFYDLKKNNRKEYDALFNGDDIDFLTVDANALISLAIAHRGQKQDLQRQALIKGKEKVRPKRFTLNRNGNTFFLNPAKKLSQLYEIDDNNLYIDKKNCSAILQRSYGEVITNDTVSTYAESLVKIAKGIEDKDKAYDFFEILLKNITPEEMENIDNHSDFYAFVRENLEDSKKLTDEEKVILLNNVEAHSASLYSAILTMGAEEYVKTVITMARTKDKMYNEAETEEVARIKTIIGDKMPKELIPEAPLKKAFAEMGVDLSFDEEEMIRLTEMLDKMSESRASRENKVSINRDDKLNGDDKVGIEENAQPETVLNSEENSETRESKEDISSDDLNKEERGASIVTTGDDLYASMSDMTGDFYYNNENNEMNFDNIFVENNQTTNMKIDKYKTNPKEEVASIKSSFSATITNDGKIAFFSPRFTGRVKRRLKPVRSMDIKKSQDELVQQLNEQKGNDGNIKTDEEPVQE